MTRQANLTLSKTLRFWIECAYADRIDTSAGQTGPELVADILCEYEQAGDAMRYLNRQGEIAWKATPKMLQRLADGEREAQADLNDLP
jgi:hypothetical protein